jgi:hypothetical protein
VHSLAAIDNTEACFGCVPHCRILDEMRRQIEDKRMLALLSLFPKAGVMQETVGSRGR